MNITLIAIPVWNAIKHKKKWSYGKIRLETCVDHKAQPMETFLIKLSIKNDISVSCKLYLIGCTRATIYVFGFYYFFILFFWWNTMFVLLVEQFCIDEALLAHTKWHYITTTLKIAQHLNAKTIMYSKSFNNNFRLLFVILNKWTPLM